MEVTLLDRMWEDGEMIRLINISLPIISFRLKCNRQTLLQMFTDLQVLCQTRLSLEEMQSIMMHAVCTAMPNSLSLTCFASPFDQISITCKLELVNRLISLQVLAMVISMETTVLACLKLLHRAVLCRHMAQALLVPLVHPLDLAHLAHLDHIDRLSDQARLVHLSDQDRPVHLLDPARPVHRSDPDRPVHRPSDLKETPLRKSGCPRQAGLPEQREDQPSDSGYGYCPDGPV